MRILPAIILGALASAPLPAQAQSTDLGHSLSQLIDTAVTKSKQRKILAELSAALSYQSAAGPMDPTDRSDPRNFDVAGVRLGMSVREAEAALRTAGYRSEGARDDQPSYAGKVMQRWQSDFGFKGAWNDRVPSELLWRRGEEEITVGLIALPQGAVVNSVQYVAKDGTPISDAEFVSRVHAKYGEPVNNDASDLRWCTMRAPECEDPREATYPLLSVWPANKHINLTGNDPARAAALEERFAADVERRRPEGGAASF